MYACFICPISPTLGMSKPGNCDFGVLDFGEVVRLQTFDVLPAFTVSAYFITSEWSKLRNWIPEDLILLVIRFWNLEFSVFSELWCQTYLTLIVHNSKTVRSWNFGDSIVVSKPEVFCLETWNQFSEGRVLLDIINIHSDLINCSLRFVSN